MLKMDSKVSHIVRRKSFIDEGYHPHNMYKDKDEHMLKDKLRIKHDTNAFV